MVFCVNDVVHHFKTGRQGVVTGWERGHTHMWILFDDGEEKPRRKAAFNKGEWWRTGKVRLTLGTGETRLGGSEYGSTVVARQVWVQTRVVVRRSGEDAHGYECLC